MEKTIKDRFDLVEFDQPCDDIELFEIEHSNSGIYMTVVEHEQALAERDRENKELRECLGELLDLIDRAANLDTAIDKARKLRERRKE